MTRSANGAAQSAPAALDDGAHYTVLELMSGRPDNGHWRRSPTMLDRLQRVTYSSQSDAEAAIAELCELTEDEPSRYRIEGVDGPPEIRSYRSGSKVSYAERKRAGWTLLRAELDERTTKRFAEICEHEGLSRADMIRTMIDGTWAEMRDSGEIK